MDNTCEIKIASEDEIEPKEHCNSFVTVFSCNWPLPGSLDEPREKIVRTKITTLSIDRTNAKYKGKTLALRVGVNASSGSWKRNWSFEGISVEVQT